MPERDGYIHGVPCWSDTQQPDPAAIVPFYAGLFGWECTDVMPTDGEGRYFMAQLRGLNAAAIGSIPRSAPQIAMWNTYVWVDSADDAAAKAADAGGTVLMEPFDVMDSGRMAYCADPEGALFGVWQADQHRGAQVVNEHGSVVFNTLATRDLGAAKKFYGAVFGWDLLDLPSGAMWMLPGYGDHLEELTPGIREQMAGMGAPEGFIDVVAAVNPIAADDPETQPHWDVTFAVDDADAAAEKASDLGGEVVTPPIDAPWVRMTVLKDPAGAVFVASQFVLENKDLPAPQ